MSHQLTAEQIQENWDLFQSNITKFISGERGDRLLDMYRRMEDHIVLAPAGISKSNHNPIPGGYVDHVNRVLEVALTLDPIWSKFGGHTDHTQEELAFICINHDLGKLGLPDTPGTHPNDNDWEINKLGRVYKYNTVLPFATVPDRSLFILQSESIFVSYNEYLGIKLHDGLYDEANKPYYISYQPESRFRNYLPILVHHADMLAARVEWESEWFGAFSVANKKPVKPAQSIGSKPGLKASQSAMKRLGQNNPGILNALKNL